MADKKELRKLLRSRRQQYAELQAEYSKRVMEQLMQHPRFLAAETVMLYHALPDEVDTQSILQGFYQQKQLLLPVIDGDTMFPVCYTGEDNLHAGSYNINEPQGAPFTRLSSIDLVIAPGMAFDTAGRRMGRGKGYYDRFLAQPELANTYKIGVCFPFQLLPEVPVDAHDICMDEVLFGD